MAAVGPWIVMRRKVGAVFYAGVVVLPKFDEGDRIGVFKPRLAESVEAGNGGLLRVSNKPMNGFLPVDVGLMFEVPADRVVYRFKDEPGDGDGKDQHDKASAGRERRAHRVACSQAPAGAKASG